MALELHRREPWRRRCARGCVRDDERGGVLAEEDLVLHLGKTRQGCKGEGGVTLDDEVIPDVGQGRKIDAGEPVVVTDAEVSLCPREHGIG